MAGLVATGPGLRPVQTEALDADHLLVNTLEQSVAIDLRTGGALAAH